MKSYGVKIESSLVKFSQKLFFKKVSLSATASNVLTLNSNDELTRVASSNLSFDGLINTSVDTNKFVVLGSDGYLAYRTGTEIQSDLDVTPGTDVVNLVTMISDSGDGARSPQTGQPVFRILGGTDVGVTNSGDTFTVAFTNDTGYTTNAGDITSVKFTSSVGSHTESSGDAEFVLAGSNGLGVTNVNETFTITAVNASASNKGVASFSSGDFTVSSGAVSLHGDVLKEDSEVVSIGDDDDGVAQIKRLRHTDDAGGDLYVRGGDATGTDKAGGGLQLFGGRATGSGTGGSVVIQAGETNASSGTTLRGANTIASFRPDGNTLLTGNLIFEGPVVDGNDTEFVITEQTANRTITVPDASGTMAFLDSTFTTASQPNITSLGTLTAL